jgi:hypothetical protein
VEVEIRTQVVPQLRAQLRRDLRSAHRFDLRKTAEPAKQLGELGRILKVLVQPLEALPDEQAAERVAECRPGNVVG